ncbi:hypothetical protein ACGFMM_20445 [Streptomyces sp. NPDC048604]|uniref:hypothetical protein n=1 Tax=Streptomyces sp. NPDC048604 TaxID=3365578 RepID=UPI00371B8FA2
MPTNAHPTPPPLPPHMPPPVPAQPQPTAQAQPLPTAPAPQPAGAAPQAQLTGPPTPPAPAPQTPHAPAPAPAQQLPTAPAQFQPTAQAQPLPTAPAPQPAAPAPQTPLTGPPTPPAPAAPMPPPIPTAARQPAPQPVPPNPAAQAMPAPAVPQPAAAAPPRPAPAAPWVVPAAPVYPGSETTTRLRPTPPAYTYFGAPPETPSETTAQLRPIRERRFGWVVAAGTCLVLGLGLVGGAIAGVVLTQQGHGAAQEPAGYAEARRAWHSTPVDTLFPPTLKGARSGPGGADRTWTRLAVAPDAPCTAAVLSPALVTSLRPTGCVRVVRATYTDATSTDVVTVGLVFTDADATAMQTLTRQFTSGGLAKRVDHMPRALPAPGTPAARFGDAQRASWQLAAVPELPVLVYAVSGFADGRPVPRPQPAAEAMDPRQTTAPAQAGLGHEAKGVADRVERGLRRAVAAATQEDR